MSTAMKKHATTMSPQEEQEHQLNQSIEHYKLEDWVETIPGGFQTLRLFSDWKIALLVFKSVMVLFVLLKFSAEPEAKSLAFSVFAFFCLASLVFAFIFGLTRKVVFDLENDEARVTVLGIPVSRKRLQDMVSLSYRYGNTVYIAFQDQSKMRVVNLGAGKKLENLKRFILEALTMKAGDAERQPEVPEREERLPIDPTSPGLSLDTLRSAVWDDTQDHNIKNLAELLIMALNDWPRETLEIDPIIKEMKAYFGEPLTVERLKSKRFDNSMPLNSWRLEAGASLWEMIELSTKLENESDFDKILARILDHYVPYGLP